MWERIMVVNSFVVWPLSVMFLIYAAARTVLLFEWKLFIVAFIVFGLATIGEIVLGILADS